MKKVSIIVPAYNEEETIGEVLNDIDQAMKREDGFNYEIIVVDDGSDDGTKDIVMKTNAKLMQHSNNMGYGASLKTGIKNANGDIIVITDADGTYPSEDIPILLSYIDTYDMVVASRTGRNLRTPVLRKLAKFFLTKLASYLSETKIPDLNSGLRAFKKKTALKFFNILPSGFSFTATITLAMLTNNYSVKYFPIDYRKREGKSKIRPVRDTLNFIALIAKTMMYFNPLRIFLPLSGMLFLLGAGIFLYSLYFTPRVMDITTVVVVMTAVQVAVTGLLADLINKRVK